VRRSRCNNRAQLRRTIPLNLQPHGVAAAAALQFVFHGGQQVGDFFLVNVKLTLRVTRNRQ
jgi:hypothetical protein